MSTYRLNQLFARLKSIVLAGASLRPALPGRAVLRNLLSAGFEGPIHLINPHYDEIPKGSAPSGPWMSCPTHPS